jgi:predicted NAD/FAD-binding protein
MRMSNASALPIAQRRAIGDADRIRPLDTPGEAQDLLNWLHGECRTPSACNQGPRVAVIGGGISGLGAAWALRQGARPTLFESAARLGGHANTVDLSLDGVTHGVDTGFLVFNARTYPLLLTLFESLGVELAPSRMGFSVQHHELGLEWAGNDLSSVFAQRCRLFDASFLGMLAELARFNRLTTRIARAGHDAELDEPLQVFLDRHRFGAMFRQAYLLPMIACIWSCPADRMLHFPAGSLIRFCHNHGLLRIRHRPQWMTVRGGSREYVQKMRAQLPDVREGEPVRRVQRLSGGRVRLHRQNGCEDFDAVVLACHSDQALALLDRPTPDECAVLGAVRYQVNRAVLHLDAQMLPRRRRAWAAWNFEARTGDDARRPVCLHYLINELQPLPWKLPVIVSMNPLREPRHVQASFDYAHPVLDAAAARAQRRLDAIQGQGGVWYAGAWTRFGFHEDGLRSGLAVARALRRRFAQAWMSA